MIPYTYILYIVFVCLLFVSISEVLLLALSYIAILTKVNTTILLERYPGEQTTMTAQGPFNTNLKVQ